MIGSPPARAAGSAGAGFSPIDPVRAGWNPAALADLLDYLQAQRSTGVLIVQDRRVVAQKNWPLPPDAARFRASFVHGVSADGALIEDVASAQKSFVAVLAAIAIERGKLDVERPVAAYLGAGWSKASPEQEAPIRVRHLLEMNSGLSERFTFEAAPGATFVYNTPAYALMKSVLAAAAGQTLETISRDWLTTPLGMADTRWALRPAALADVSNPTGLATTPRDLALLGQLVLDGGLTMQGKRVVSAKGLAALFTPTATNPAYGRLWWLNGSAWAMKPMRLQIEGPLIPSAPWDLVAALGASDRKLYVVPSRRLVIVRMGQAAPDHQFDAEIWRRVIRAAPKP